MDKATHIPAKSGVVRIKYGSRVMDSKAWKRGMKQLAFKFSGEVPMTHVTMLSTFSVEGTDVEMEALLCQRGLPKMMHRNEILTLEFPDGECHFIFGGEYQIA